MSSAVEAAVKGVDELKMKTTGDSGAVELRNDKAPNGVQTAVPLIIKDSDISGGGLGMFTKEKITAGEEILRIDQPLFLMGEPSSCGNCLHSVDSILASTGHLRVSQEDFSKLQKCGACKVVAYCSKGCQRKHWKRIHKYECKFLKEAEGISGIKFRSLLLVFRILCLYVGGQISDEIWASIKSLVSQTERLERLVNLSVHHQVNLRSMVKAFKGSGFPEKEVDELFYRVLLNAISLETSEGHLTAIMIHPQVSRINHSCDPNAYWFSDGASFRLRSCKDIPEGGEIRISYCQTTYDYIHRQIEMKRHYGFECACSRCEGESATKEEGDGTVRFEFQPGVHEAQKQMRDTTIWRLAECNIDRSAASDVYQGLEKLFKELSMIAANAVPGKTWPAYLEPVPSLNFQFIDSYLLTDDIVAAFRTALRTNYIYDPNVFTAPVDINRTMHRIVFLSVMNTLFNEPGTPGLMSELAELAWMEKELELMKFNHHHRLVQDSKKALGADCKMSLALEHWFNVCYDGFTNPNARYNIEWLSRGSEEERKKEVDAAEKKILQWSGILKPSTECWFLSRK